MPISKDSKEILKEEILNLSEQLSTAQRIFDLAQVKFQNAKEEFERARMNLDLIKEKKKALQADVNAN